MARPKMQITQEGFHVIFPDWNLEKAFIEGVPGWSAVRGTQKFSATRLAEVGAQIYAAKEKD